MKFPVDQPRIEDTLPIRDFKKKKAERHLSVQSQVMGRLHRNTIHWDTMEEIQPTESQVAIINEASRATVASLSGDESSNDSMQSPGQKDSEEEMIMVATPESKKKDTSVEANETNDAGSDSEEEENDDEDLEMEGSESMEEEEKPDKSNDKGEETGDESSMKSSSSSGSSSSNLSRMMTGMETPPPKIILGEMTSKNSEDEDEGKELPLSTTPDSAVPLFKLIDEATPKPADRSIDKLEDSKKPAATKSKPNESTRKDETLEAAVGKMTPAQQRRAAMDANIKEKMKAAAIRKAEEAEAKKKKQAQKSPIRQKQKPAATPLGAKRKRSPTARNAAKRNRAKTNSARLDEEEDV